MQGTACGSALGYGSELQAKGSRATQCRACSRSRTLTRLSFFLSAQDRATTVGLQASPSARSNTQRPYPTCSASWLAPCSRSSRSCCSSRGYSLTFEVSSACTVPSGSPDGLRRADRPTVASFAAASVLKASSSGVILLVLLYQALAVHAGDAPPADDALPVLVATAATAAVAAAAGINGGRKRPYPYAAGTQPCRLPVTCVPCVGACHALGFGTMSVPQPNGGSRTYSTPVCQSFLHGRVNGMPLPVSQCTCRTLVWFAPREYPIRTRVHWARIGGGRLAAEFASRRLDGCIWTVACCRPGADAEGDCPSRCPAC